MIGSAIQERARRDALSAGTAAIRHYVTAHPGRYAAGNDARATGVDDPPSPLPPTECSAHGPPSCTATGRMLRSTLHGFVTFEVGGSFRIAADVVASFTWIVDFMDRGLRAMEAEALPGGG